MSLLDKEGKTQKLVLSVTYSRMIYTRPAAGMKTDQTGWVLALHWIFSAALNLMSHFSPSLSLSLSLSEPASVSLVRPDPEGESSPAKSESPSQGREPSSKMEAVRRAATPTTKPDPASPGSPLPRSKRGKDRSPWSPVGFLRSIWTEQWYHYSPYRSSVNSSWTCSLLFWSTYVLLLLLNLIWCWGQNALCWDLQSLYIGGAAVCFFLAPHVSDLFATWQRFKAVGEILASNLIPPWCCYGDRTSSSNQLLALLIATHRAVANEGRIKARPLMLTGQLASSTCYVASGLAAQSLSLSPSARPGRSECPGSVLLPLL